MTPQPQPFRAVRIKLTVSMFFSFLSAWHFTSTHIDVVCSVELQQRQHCTDYEHQLERSQRRYQRRELRANHNRGQIGNHSHANTTVCFEARL